MPITTSEVSVDNTPLSITGSISVANFPATQPISGSGIVTNFPATQPISGSVGIIGSVSVPGTFFQAIQPVSGTVAVSNFPSGAVASAVVTSNTVGTSAVTLLASRPARVTAVIFNETGTLFIKAGIGASASDYTWRLTANTELDINQYTGIVTAVKQSGTTNVQVTDF